MNRVMDKSVISDPEEMILTSSINYEEVTEKTLDKIVFQFVDLSRDIPDAGMRNFESEVSTDANETMRAQSMFALYVLGKMTPTFDLWQREKSWVVHDPS
tara:strand:- start:2730 stop:3029 length:300 start_codon:yes stop_codon:yes gene_type:complete